MSVDSKYIFKEAQLDTTFAKENITEATDLINRSISFSILGIPTSGISIFVKKLTTLPLGYFVYVDAYALATHTQIEFFRVLLKELEGSYEDDDTVDILVQKCKQQVENLLEREEKIIFVFNRFDQLMDIFDKSFFDTLRCFQQLNEQKIVMIFALCRTIHELAGEYLAGKDIAFYSTIFYLKPYSENDLRQLLKLHGPEFDGSEVNLNKALKLSGGHFQLLQLIIRSGFFDNSLKDPFIKMSLKNIHDHLSYKQKKIVQQIAMNKAVTVEDEYLLNLAIIRPTENGYEFFTPLFGEYIKQNMSFKLPAKEGKLFKLLKSKVDEVVSKEEIFTHLWKQDDDRATDWALDALIYRMRKNPAFKNSGYQIESHKKVGYRLFKI